MGDIVMEKASWIHVQLAAWGYRGVFVSSSSDKKIYLEKKVADALTDEQLTILKLTRDNDSQFNSARHQMAGKAMVAFRYH